MTNTTDSTAALDVLARRRIELVARRDDIAQAIADVDAALLVLLQPGETALVDGQPAWTVTAGNRRWNDDKARDVLPETLLDAITVTEPHIDPKTARGILPPDLYTACCTEGKPYVKKAGGK